MRFSILDPRYSLRARIALIVACLTLMLALVLTAITGQISGAQLERSIGGNLAQLSGTVASQIDRTLFERWREIRNIASQSVLFAAQDTTSARALLDRLKETYRYYAWIGWADPSGAILVGAGGLLEGQNVADRAWFKQARTANTPYVGEMHDTPLLASLAPNADGDPSRSIDIAMPIRNTDGSLLGVLIAELDWRFLREQSGSIEQQVGKPNAPRFSPDRLEVFILAPDGTVLLGPPPFIAPTMSNLPKLNLQSVQAAQNGASGYMTETWTDTQSAWLTGYATSSGYRGFTGMGWIVLIRQRADVALASIAQLQVLIFGIGVLFAIVFSIMGWLLAVRMTRPLAQVVQRAREIRTGDDTGSVSVLRGDEVSVLSSALDRLLVSLDQRNMQLTSLNANLEKMVEQRTAQLEASQRFNEKMMSTAPDVVYIYDVAAGRNIYLNQAANTLLGYSAEELLTFDAARLAALIHPDDYSRVQALRDQIRNAPDAALTEHAYRFRHCAGYWIWVECRETAFARDEYGAVSQIFGVAQDITLRKQAEAKLQEAAAAQERQRLARELHDSVSQTLFSATMVAQTLPLLWDKGEVVVKENLGELARLTRGALAEMRTLLNELRPQAIETANLAELLTQLLDAARGRTKAECTLTLEGRDALPTAVQVAVYRVAQEALNNTTKHARARHVEVSVTHTADSLTMSIRDDGRGFQQEQSSSVHFGLGIMRERAEEVGAQVRIESQPGRGTQIVFDWREGVPMLEGVPA